MTTLLSVAETYFVSTLGMDAMADASLVVPVMMLMTMVSNGGIGGGVSSAIARARSAGRQDDAESMAWHTVVIAVAAGALFSLALLLAGPVLYRSLGGSGQSLEQAVNHVPTARKKSRVFPEKNRQGRQSSAFIELASRPSYAQ